MDDRVVWVVQELKSRLVEQGYILYVHCAESGSIYITIDLGMGPRIRISDHDILYKDGVNFNIQPKTLKDSKLTTVKLRKSITVIEKAISFVSQYINEVKYQIACEKYNKLIEHRHLSPNETYGDLFEVCSMFANREYKNRVSTRREKSKRNMKKYKNSIYFYK